MNKSRKGKKGNIWKFLRDNWYLASTGFLTLVMVVLIVIFILSTPKSKANTIADKCVANTERYITDVAIAKGDSCPDGYYDANTNGKSPLHIQEIGTNDITDTGYKLCYQIPEQMCNSNSIVTNITANPFGENANCNNCDDTITCSTEGKTLNLSKLSCRCTNCDDTPVDYYDNEGLINISCGGVTNLDQDNPAVLCTSQQSFDKKLKGIKSVRLDQSCQNGSRVLGTNICIQK
jgi:hypothetical protein